MISFFGNLCGLLSVSDQKYLDQKKYDKLYGTNELYAQLEKIRDIDPKNFLNSPDLERSVKINLKALGEFYLDGSSEEKAKESFKHAASKCSRTRQYILDNFTFVKGDPSTRRSIKNAVILTISSIP